MNADGQVIQQFSYYRGLAPMMWVFFCLGLLEMAVVHFVLVQIWPYVALLLSLLSGASLLWIFFVIRSLKTHPILIDQGRLIMRCGILKSVEIAPGAVVGLRTKWESDALKAEGMRNLSLLAYPNVIVDLCPALESRRFGRARRIHSVVHRIDDLPAFVAALTVNQILTETDHGSR